MALRNVQRYTVSLPKTTVIKLEIAVPKNNRSKFIAEQIEKGLAKKDIITLEDIHEIWSNLAKKYPRKTKKTAVELQREDRLSH